MTTVSDTNWLEFKQVGGETVCIRPSCVMWFVKYQSSMVKVYTDYAIMIIVMDYDSFKAKMGVKL